MFLFAQYLLCKGLQLHNTPWCTAADKQNEFVLLLVQYFTAKKYRLCSAAMHWEGGGKEGEGRGGGGG